MKTSLLLLPLISSTASLNQQIDQSLYQGTTGTQFLIRFLDASTSVGCHGTVSKPTGILKLITTQEQMNLHLQDDPSIHQKSYALVLPYALFTPENLDVLVDQKAPSGILLILNDTISLDTQVITTRPATFSPAQRRPFPPPGSVGVDWNPNGTSQSMRSFSYPVVSLTDSQTLMEIIDACSQNSQRSMSSSPIPMLYSVQWELVQAAAVNSGVCLRRGRCHVVGGYSVWGSFTDYSVTVAARAKPIIVISAWLGGDSFIRGQGGGAASQFTGTVAALAIADALSKSPTVNTLPKSILFGLWSSEPFSNAGSTRFAQDISGPGFVCRSRSQNAYCSAKPPTGCSDPCHHHTDFSRIRIEDLEGILDFSNLQSLATRPAADTFYMHASEAVAVAGVSNIVGALAGSYGVVSSLDGTSRTNITLARAWNGTGLNRGLPPSSLQSFLKHRDIPGITVGDFQDVFRNPYYNSEWDDARDLSDAHVERLCGFVDATAKMVYRWASMNESIADVAVPGIPAPVSVNCSYVKALLECYTRDPGCATFAALGQSNPKLSAYSVFRNDELLISPVSLITHGLLYLTMPKYQIVDGGGEANLSSSIKTCRETSECAFSYGCYNGQCITSKTRFHNAYGTGLDFSMDTGAFFVSNASNGGTWTQSKYFSANMRIFVAASDVYSGVSFGVSVLVSLLTWLAVRTFKMRILDK